MAPGTRPAGRRQHGPPGPDRTTRVRRLGGLAVIGVALGLVGWAMVPGGDAPLPGNGTAPGAVAKSVAVPAGWLKSSPTTSSSSAAEAVPTPSATPDAAPEIPDAVPEIPAGGPGTFTVTPGQSGRAGTGPTLLTYTVEVETGLPFDPIQVAAVVDATLADPRSWIAEGRHSFQRVASGGDVRILVATPGTTDELCAPLRTHGEVSCRNGGNVVLNALRWAFAVPHYEGDVDAYRQYLVNHEVGHVLGESHVPCPAPGEVAPVMLQQTYGLDGCLPNSWPYP